MTPAHTLVAAGEVKFVISGLVPTLKVAVLLAEGLLVQPTALAIPVIVTVVAPIEGQEAPGIEKVPLEAPMVSVAVLPVAVLAPLRLYVTVKVPAPSVVEFTVTVDAPPLHELVAVGAVKLEMLGNVPNTMVIAGLTLVVPVAQVIRLR